MSQQPLCNFSRSYRGPSICNAKVLPGCQHCPKHIDTMKKRRYLLSHRCCVYFPNADTSENGFCGHKVTEHHGRVYIFCDYHQRIIVSKFSYTHREPNPVRQEPNPVRQEQIPVRQEPNPVRQEPNPVRQEPNPVRQEQIPVRQEQIPVRQEQIPVRIVGQKRSFEDIEDTPVDRAHMLLNSLNPVIENLADKEALLIADIESYQACIELFIKKAEYEKAEENLAKKQKRHTDLLANILKR